MRNITSLRQRILPNIRTFRTFAVGILTFFLCGILMSYALDVVNINFSPQSATWTGSNNSQIWFSTGGSLSGTTSYINKNNDSDTVGNYRRWDYYDTRLGFFKLDWNTTDTTKNVRILSSTDKCSSWYGYKFWGYAESSTVGYIQFDHDINNFVYYCESDKKLHGWAYSEQTGFQSFEGISFEILAVAQNPQSLPSWNDPLFVNNATKILINTTTSSNAVQTQTNTIQGKGLAKKTGQEIFFYIVK